MTVASPSFVSVKGLCKTFGSAEVIDNVDLEIKQYEVLAMVGPSGCGKSTFLRILAGLDIDYSGKVLVDGRKPQESVKERQTGLLSQDSVLLPWRTALDNALLPIDLQRDRTPVDISDAKCLLSKLGLSDHLKSRPQQLSGGMRQRVSLAQLLVMRQELLLFDEPFSKLDEPLRWQLTGLMHDFLSDRTAVWVTHSVDEAVAMGDRVGIWYKAPGHRGYRLRIERGLRQSITFGKTGLPDLAALKDESQRILSLQIELNEEAGDVISPSAFEELPEKIG